MEEEEDEEKEEEANVCRCTTSKQSGTGPQTEEEVYRQSDTGPCRCGARRHASCGSTGPGRWRKGSGTAATSWTRA